ncbi:hypothetical protein MIND_00750700 [Mycena indigotica]|uniref:Uncharacterized protein n=1 Tax=Mycena indigotica TaxID=2126181 RepID=A0A8H6W4V2_9AGAR|nr:uncharacterized protein MIND_00750700 [Mycena indigotica]KAF7301848.1 hypothetical protein MIND_00750700 [Mycena indigotica]
MTSIFAAPKTKRNAARKIHIRRLYDMMNIAIQRNDYVRANRAWSILARCPEVDWKALWTTGVYLVAEGLDDHEKLSSKIDFLRVMMLQRPSDKEIILKELCLRLILSGRYREALDDLELYLPSFPYQDNPILNIYAGLLTLYLAQSPQQGQANGPNPKLMRDAQTYFERAASLQPDFTLAQGYLDLLGTMAGQSQASPSDEDQDEIVSPQSDLPRRKRMRTNLMMQFPA